MRGRMLSSFTNCESLLTSVLAKRVLSWSLRARFFSEHSVLKACYTVHRWHTSSDLLCPNRELRPIHSTAKLSGDTEATTHPQSPSLCSPLRLWRGPDKLRKATEGERAFSFLELITGQFLGTVFYRYLPL